MYQNPEPYYQIHYTQIKGATQIPSISYGWEGMRTYKFAHHFNLPDKHNFFTKKDVAFVKDFQKKHDLPVTGEIDYKTWETMGFSKHDWKELDNYIPRTPTDTTMTRADHIETGIKHIKKYIGGLWIAGTCSDPQIKKADCSGLATQYLMAGGIYPYPSESPMVHASPNNEWDSQKLWASKKLKHIPFADRQRGDLIFFTDPKNGKIWHVGVLTSKDKMLDSWPPIIKHHSINYKKQHGNIAGVKRPFL